VEQYFHGQLDLVLGGALGGRKNPSLIRNLATGEVVRPGWCTCWPGLGRVPEPSPHNPLVFSDFCQGGCL